MVIRGLGTATPLRRYSQKECWEVLRVSTEYRQLNSRSQAILRKVLLSDNGIEARHLALDHLEEAFQLDPDSLHARFTRHAPALAAQAAQRALAEAQLTPDDIDAVLISTCTGYLCPGLTSYVSELLGLRGDVLALDLVGQGCGAALPNLRAGEALISGGKSQHVLSICVEVCSAAFFLDNDPGVLISACLFGDGAAAAVLSTAPVAGRRRLEWRHGSSLLSPADRDYLRFEQRAGMLRNILSQQVPSMAGKYAAVLLSETLRQLNLRRTDISAWVLHAGGRDVLQTLRQRLDLTAPQVAASTQILCEHGNLSSPFVLFVLAEMLPTAPPGLWWLSSFGAGFSCHGALLEAS